MSFYCHTDAQNAPLFSLVCVFLLTKLKVPNHQNVLFRYFPLCDHNGAKTGYTFTSNDGTETRYSKKADTLILHFSFGNSSIPY